MTEAEGQTAVFTMDFAACFYSGPHTQNIQKSSTTLRLQNSWREGRVDASPPTAQQTRLVPSTTAKTVVTHVKPPRWPTRLQEARVGATEAIQHLRDINNQRDDCGKQIPYRTLLLMDCILELPSHRIGLCAERSHPGGVEKEPTRP